MRAAHASQAPSQDPAALQIATIVLATRFGKGLVGALHNALSADVDPGAGRHLAIHHEPLAVELAEVIPVRPVRHQVGVGDQDPRRIRVGTKHTHRLAGLHQQGLVGLELAQRLDNQVKVLPGAGRPTNASIHHQALGVLGHIWVQVVHQHAQGRFGKPTFGGDLRSGGRRDHAVSIARVRHP